MICYDITDRESFESVKQWMVEIERYATESVNRMLIGNKCDKEADRKVSFEEGAALAKQYEVPFLETSAKNNHNVEATFNTMAMEIKRKLGSQPFAERQRRTLKRNTASKDSVSGCCK